MKKPERNWKGIQFEELRKKVDPKFNSVHDELSDCYYNKKPFKNYGILDKEKFDKLHGLIFYLRDIEFHEENLRQPEKDRIPEKKYNEVFDPKTGNIIGKKNEKSFEKVAELKNQGIELTI